MDGLLSDSDTEKPPTGASPDKLIVAVEGDPQSTEAGEKISSARVAAVIVNEAFFEEVPR